MIIPAYNEAAVIERTLYPLSEAAAGGFIELIVVCNGCSDATADVARASPVPSLGTGRGFETSCAQRRR